LSRAASRVDRTELTGFVGRLDASIAALDAYANPELMLDTLLLAWPD
jgi:hypothetical protein